MYLQDHRLILVVAGETQRAQVGQTVNVVDVTLQVKLHLKGAVPLLEREHGLPVGPEVRGVELIVKHVIDLLVLEGLVGRHEQLEQLRGGTRRQAVLAVGMGILALLLRGTAERVVRICLVEPVILIQHAYALRLNGRDGAEQVPHALEMVVHLAAAAHHIADIVLVAVAGTAGQGLLLEHMDMLALHLAVTHQITCSRQCSQTGTNDICRFMIDTLRLFRSCKCFIVATGIVHRKASLLFIPYSSLMLLSMATVYPALARRTTNKLCPLYKI